MKKKGATRASAPKKALKAHDKIVPSEVAFRTLDGKELRSIIELAHELDTMADHVFYHHVTQDRNDFANWIKDVFGMPDLASELSQLKQKDKTQVVILKYIVKGK